VLQRISNYSDAVGDQRILENISDSKKWQSFLRNYYTLTRFKSSKGEFGSCIKAP
jgi:hypothetical protein